MRFAWCAVLAACGSPGSVTQIELGTGTSEFVAVAEGGDNELVYGPQGGWHLTLALKVWTVDRAIPSELQLDYATDRTDGSRLGSTHLIVDGVRLLRDSDHLLRLGDRVVLDITDPAMVVGTQVEISASVDGVDQRKTVVVVDLLP